MSGKFHLKKACDGQFQFSLEASNGQPILIGEPYRAKDAALDGIRAVRKRVQCEEAFEPLTSQDGHPYFVLTGSNGQVIGHSQMYTSPAGCKLGMDSVRRHAPEALLVDETLFA